MRVVEQYDVLVEMMARARVLAALSDSSDIVSEMESVKTHLTNAAVELGCERTLFNTDSITRYAELIED